METKLGSHQGNVNQDHRSIGVLNDTEWQDYFSAINSRVTFPVQMLAREPEEASFDIDISVVTLADGRKVSAPPLAGLPLNFTGGSVNSVANTETGDIIPIDYPVASTVDEYVRMGLILQSDGQIRAVFNKLSLTPGGDGIIPFSDDEYNIGYIDLVSLGAGTSYKGANASSGDVITNDDITQFSSAGSSAGSDEGASKVPADGFVALVFDTFDVTPDNDESKVDDSLTTATYNNQTKSYQILCERGALVTQTVNTAGNDEVQRISFGAVPGSGQWQLDLDGQQSTLLDFDATAEEVEAAIEGMAAVEDVDVTGNYTDDFLVKFKGTLSETDVNTMTVFFNDTGESINITEDTAGSPSNIDFSLDIAPGYTIAVNDAIIVSGEVRRIAALTDQQNGKLDAPFTGTISGATCVISQALYTKDLVNAVGDASEETRIRDFFPDLKIEKIHIEYSDSEGSEDPVPDYADEAAVSVIASNQGNNEATNIPEFDSFGPIYTRPIVNEQEQDYYMQTEAPPNDDYERLILVFFANPNHSGLATTVNIHDHDTSLVERATLQSSSIIESAFAMTVAGAPVNSNSPDHSGSETTWQLGFNSNLRTNPGETQGETLVFADGQLIPRRIVGSTQDAWWEPVSGSNSAVRFHTLLNGSNLSLEAVRLLGTIDTSDTNALQIQSFYDAIVGTQDQLDQGIATHLTIQSAYDYLAASPNPGRMLVLTTTTENLVLANDDVVIEGKGRKTGVIGTVQIDGDYNIIKMIKIDGNITLNGGGNFISESFKSLGSLVTDNGAGNDVNIVTE